MTVITLPQRASPSWQTGFARYAGESLYPNLWNGLVGAWVPALGPTGLVLRDVSGWGNHGTLTNMDPATDWVVGEKGYALDFDGSNDYVSLGNVCNLSNVLSASMWFNPVSLAGDKGFFCRTSAASPYVQYGFKCNADVLRWYIFSGGAARFFSFNPQPSLGSWQHVAGVSQPGKQVCYLNGVVAGSAAWSTVEAADGLSLNVARYMYSANYATTSIVNAMLWDRALSPNEIQQLYADPLGMFRRRRLFPVKAPAAGGFQPAWALHANVLIGT